MPSLLSSKMNTTLVLITVALVSLTINIGGTNAFVSPKRRQQQQQRKSWLAMTATTKSPIESDVEKERNKYGMTHGSMSMNDEEIESLVNSDMEKARLSTQYAKFNYLDWLYHRSSDRFYRTLFDFDKSPIVANLLDEAGVIALISIFIIVYNGLFSVGFTDFNEVTHPPLLADAFPSWFAVKLALPIEPFSLCIGPLGLLIVFRNDACFNRYTRAFHELENTFSALNNMIMMCSHSSKNVVSVKNIGIASWVASRTLKFETRDGFDTIEKYESDVRNAYAQADDEASSDFVDAQLNRLMNARDKMHVAKFNVHDAVNQLEDEVTNLDKRTLINNFNECSHNINDCITMYRTPIPLLYTRWTLKFLTFWMTFMPFAFYNVFEDSWNHLAMIPGLLIICFLFFGVEEIAVSLEEPFSILPIDEMVDELNENIDNTVTWMAEREEAAAASSSKKQAAQLNGVTNVSTTNESSQTSKQQQSNNNVYLSAAAAAAAGAEWK